MRRLGKELLDECEHEVDVDVAFVDLVENDVRVCGEDTRFRIDEFFQEDASCFEEDASLRRTEEVHAHLITDFLAQSEVHFMTQATGDRCRCQTTGLRDQDARKRSAEVERGVVEELRDLSGFTTSCRTADDGQLVGGDCGEDFRVLGENGESGVEVEGVGKRGRGKKGRMGTFGVEESG